MIPRLRLRRPPPHGAEQPPQPDQRLCTQSIGHASAGPSSQVCSRNVGGQDAPGASSLPPASIVGPASDTMSRVTFWVPPPHDTLHSCSTQSPTSQSWISGIQLVSSPDSCWYTSRRMTL